MLPRLEAEETLARATAAGLGSGMMRPEEARRIIARLERRAGGTTAAAADPSTSAGRALLSNMGIEVEEA